MSQKSAKRKRHEKGLSQVPTSGFAVPFWFKVVLLISVLIRFHLVVHTEGTYDMGLWEKHAQQIHHLGLIEYYKVSSQEQMKFNHPPFMGFFAEFILLASQKIGVPFKILFRGVFATLDFVTAFYFLKLFQNKRKFLYASLYLLSPITFIMSAYHGNTDSLVGLVILVTIFYLSEKKYFLAGLVFGSGLWVKWIIILTAPVFILSIPGWWKKVKFCLSGMIMFILGYLWVICASPEVIYKNIFLYRGLMIKTNSGFLWGVRIFYDYFEKLNWSPSVVEKIHGALDFYVSHNREFILIPIVLYASLRRRYFSGLELGKSVAGVYSLFYAITNFWAFQYFAWSIPFWFFLGPRWAGVLLFCLSAYIYLLYSYLCGSIFLVGPWDLLGRSTLPEHVLFFRDVSLLLFIVLSLYLFIEELRKGIGLSSLKSVRIKDLQPNE